MADVRSLIQGDRGLLKRIQATLPGYKIYRNCEDLRAADNILRKELAAHLEQVEENAREAREDLARGMDFDSLNLIGEVVNLSHKITEKVRHAEQGYAPWISGDVRIQEEELKALYNYDLSMLDEIEKMKRVSESLKTNSTDSQKINDMKSSLKTFEKIFDQRIAKVTKVAQKEV